MVKIDEHIKEIIKTKVQIKQAITYQKKKELIKHLHKLQKQLKECRCYLKKGCD